VNGLWRIDLGMPALVEFRGPDAVRYLNGQLTQDVRRVAGANIALPSCVTDAKGCLQFRVWLTEADGGALWVEGPAQRAAELEARLTRYLIADDVEAVDLTGKWVLVHFTGVSPQVPAGVRVRQNVRFGVTGADWWIPAGLEPGFPADVPLLEGDGLEAFRIACGIPAWGRELSEGLLPPEAGLDATDISYHKGCYIGQEVISRIKYAGKVNKRLQCMVFDAGVPPEGGELVDAAGKSAGSLTSVSPALEQGMRNAMGYVKRGVNEVFLVTPDGIRHPAKLRLGGSYPG
jgi:folate-binding protein YgfZ